MRSLVVSNIMSLDGYVEGPGKNVMALPMDAFFDIENLERLRTADTLLLGATTYMGLKGFWPAVAEDPSVSPAVALDPTVADLHREIGVRNNEAHKVVVSDSLTEDDTAPWSETTTIVRRADARKAVTDLKAGSGGAILTFGSRTVWNDLLAAGLVDDLYLMLGGAVVGGGTPAFDPDVRPSLALVEVKRREGSDNLLLHYRVVR
jgi:dihydrofolate reductase